MCTLASKQFQPSLLCRMLAAAYLREHKVQQGDCIGVVSHADNELVWHNSWMYCK